MARKTNKTDHVLNLLSSGNDKEQMEDSKTEKPQPPVNPDKMPSVSVVQSSSGKEELADAIRLSLEEELEREQSGEEEKKEDMPEAVEQEEKPEGNKPEGNKSEGNKSEGNSPEGNKSEGNSPEGNKSEGNSPEGNKSEGNSPEGNKPESNKPESNKPEGNKPETITEEEPDFVYVNVMESLVKDRVVEYMEQFRICTCPRCVADTSALALTQLPPKYVVVNREAVSPLMNFYANKYAGQITVEITKACIQVGDVPHHTRN